MSKNVTKASLVVLVEELEAKNARLSQEVAHLLKKLGDLEEVAKSVLPTPTPAPATPASHNGNGEEFSSLPVSEEGRRWIAAHYTRAVPRPDGWVHIAFPRKEEATVVRLAATLRDRGIPTARVRTDAARAVLQFKR